jgi:hypothetical protein
MGLSVKFQGEFRYYSETFADAALAAAKQAHDDAVASDGGCLLGMDEIVKRGTTLSIDTSSSGPASLSFGPSAMLKALANTAIDGSVTETVDYETTEHTRYRAKGRYAPHPHSSWPQEPDKRKELAQHLLGRHLIQNLDRQGKRDLFEGWAPDQHEKLREFSLRVVSAVLETLTTDGNFVDGDDEAGVWYRLFSRIETCQGEFLEEIEIVSNSNYAAGSFSEDAWRKGQFG